MNKKISFCMITLFIFFALMPDAYAERWARAVSGSDAFQVSFLMTENLLVQVIGVVMVLGGFGLVGVSVGAIFGKVNWKWAAYLAFGLFICAMTFGVIMYFTGADFAQERDLYDTVDANSITVTPSD